MANRLRELASSDPDAARALLESLRKKVVVPHAGGQAEIMADDTRFQIVCCGRRFGKSCTIESLLPTPDGMVRMGDIQEGDYVLGLNGGPTEVTGVFPQGELDNFEVIFSDGSKVECSEDHLWTVRTRKPEYRRPWKTLTLREIMDRGITCHSGFKFKVPAPEAAQHTAKKQPIDPYLFGLLLGDGSFRNRSIKFTTADSELVEAVKRLSPTNVRPSGKYDYNLTTDRGQQNTLIEDIRSLGLMDKYSHEKNIPDVYLYGSVEQRLAILQGLLDTDGWVDGPQNHHVAFCSSSKKLAEQVIGLCRSLGGIAYMREKPTTHRLAYDVRARLPESIKPFRLKRKIDAYTPSSKTLDRSIVSIRPKGKAEMQCISVAATNEMFLASDYVPTHNTVVGAKKALKQCRKDEQMVWWCAPTYKVVKRGYREVLRQLPNDVLTHTPPQDSAFDAGRSVILKFKNGSRLEFYSAERPEAMLGEGVDFIVLDEAATMPKGVWETIVRPTLIDREGKALMISTPRGRNWFYYLWLRGQDKKQSNYMSWRFPTAANPHLPASEIEEMKATMPLLTFQQEVLAEFIASAGAVFRFNTNIIISTVKPQGHVVVGVDLAKSNDFTVFSAANADDAMPCGYDRFNEIAWGVQRNRLRQFVKDLKKNGATHVTLVMDSTGVGDPIVEEIEADGYDVVPINFTKYKHHMVTQLSKDLEDGAVRLDEEEETHEFENYAYKITDAGRWTYNAPEGQHDDCVSAKMLQHWGIVQEGAPDVTSISANDPIEEEDEDEEDLSYLYEDQVDTGIPEITTIEADSTAMLMGRREAWTGAGTV